MLMILYNTMVQPIIDYCITVRGYPLCKYIRETQRFQNSKAARIISGNWNWDKSGLLLVKRLCYLNLTQSCDYFMTATPSTVFFSTVWHFCGMSRIRKIER